MLRTRNIHIPALTIAMKLLRSEVIYDTRRRDAPSSLTGIDEIKVSLELAKFKKSFFPTSLTSWGLQKMLSPTGAEKQGLVDI